MKKIAIIFTMFLFITAPVYALKDRDLQRIFDDITFWGNSSVNVVTDKTSDNTDSYWSISGYECKFTIIAQEAGFTPHNRFGIFEAGSPGNKVELHIGKLTNRDTWFEINQRGEVWVNGYFTGQTFRSRMFGFYLDSNYYSQGGVWYSDTSLNSDGFDHMFAYQGKNDFIRLPSSLRVYGDSDYMLAFEDLVDGGDRDYTDFVVLVENIEPVFWKAPKGQAYNRYPPRTNPILNSHMKYASPVGVGDISSGVLNISVKTLPFESPVDVYMALSKDGVLIYFDENNIPKPYPVKWRAGISELINTSLYGDMSTDIFDPGVYSLFLMITPENKLNEYFIWGTYFFIPIRIGL